MPGSGHADAIVIGSGMGGLSCAAALARTGHAVIVLEQHHSAGGLTLPFRRHGFSWDVGVHSIGQVQPGGGLKDLLDWLTDGAMRFASLGLSMTGRISRTGSRSVSRRQRRRFDTGCRAAFPRTGPR